MTRKEIFMVLKVNREVILATEICEYDIICLRHIWRMSSESCGSNALIERNNLPSILKGTLVDKYFPDRLTYYRDTVGLVRNFKTCDSSKNAYYIELSDNFVDTVNYFIQTKFPRNELLKSYNSGKEIVMNNSITIGTATNVAIQQGNNGAEQAVDFFSQEKCEEIESLLDGLVSLATQDEQLSKNVLDEFAEIKEMLKSSPVKKDTIGKKITAFLQQITANCSSASKVITPIIALVSEIKKLIP